MTSAFMVATSILSIDAPTWEASPLIITTPDEDSGVEMWLILKPHETNRTLVAAVMTGLAPKAFPNVKFGNVPPELGNDQPFKKLGVRRYAAWPLALVLMVYIVRSG